MASKRLLGIKRRHFRFVASRKKSIPKTIKGAGLGDVLKQMLDQHKDKVSNLHDTAKAKVPGPDDQKVVQTFRQKTDKLKDGVDARFQKKKSSLLQAIQKKKQRLRDKRTQKPLTRRKPAPESLKTTVQYTAL